jgi:hypothetical protein
VRGRAIFPSARSYQARADFVVILDELAFLREQLAWLPTPAEARWIALRLTLGALAAIGAVALLLGLSRARLHLPVRLFCALAAFLERG